MNTNRIAMIVTFIKRGKSKAFVELLEKNNIKLHFQSVGQGTAPSEMMDIFGLGTNDKDVIISLAPEKILGQIESLFSTDVEYTPKFGGILMILPLSAINRLTSEILNRVNDSGDKGVEKMDNNAKHSLIFVTINSGYTEEVMQCARRVGAAGGTVIRARLAGSESLKMTDERELSEEKEIVSILASDNIANAIMNEINTHFGLKTEASGIVCSVPVEKAFKI